MKIIGFEKHSTGARMGLRTGDDIIKINGHSIHDIIDFRFHISDNYINITVNRNGKSFALETEKDDDDNLGLVFADTSYRCCGNHCIFCFVDQNPTGLRNNLYFKDEDFRLSFLYGNYVTLTNVSRSDLTRIARQRLSPLYISVHSTNRDIRKLMLGLKKDDHLMDKIRFLAEHHIQLHAQIVLCPGINDGQGLLQTIADLAQFHPQLNSMAIVPVGLTRHRAHLYPLQPITSEYAQQLIVQIEPVARKFKQESGNYLVYLADEFYLLANSELPPAERYENLAQIENGVGLTRDFIDHFEEQSHHFPHKIKNSRSLTLVTGMLAAPVLNRLVIPRLNAIGNLTANLMSVENQFYGTSITVSGLLTGEDIFNQLSNRALGDVIILPANCLNFDGLFLDDWTVEKLSTKLHRPVAIVDHDFVSLVEKLQIGNQKLDIFD